MINMTIFVSRTEVKSPPIRPDSRYDAVFPTYASLAVPRQLRIACRMTIFVSYRHSKSTIFPSKLGAELIPFSRSRDLHFLFKK
jgi:hypothetical protein